jgi:hypothetical protein
MFGILHHQWSSLVVAALPQRVLLLVGVCLGTFPPGCSRWNVPSLSVENEDDPNTGFRISRTGTMRGVA